jgi:hypothetical protein
MNNSEENINSVVEFYKENQHRLIQFQASVEAFFSNHPQLNAKPFPIIHSIKTRIKDPNDHNSVYVAIAGEVVNRRSVLLKNFVLNGQESASNPLLHIHANR